MPCTCSDDDKLIYDFFRTFSRAEYALKSASFLRDRRDAEADWDKFAQHAKTSELINNPQVTELSEAISYIRKHPPRKQIAQNRSLTWGNTHQTEPLPQRVFIYIRRVRNNLFHGGKSPWNPERDLPLLRASLTILNAAIQAHPEVKNAYENE